MSIFSPNIIKTGLLGTNAKKLELSIFPPAVQEHLDETKDSPLVFLDGVALTHAYTFGGQELVKIEGISSTIPVCPDETLPYCDVYTEEALRLILKENNYSLTTFLPLLVQGVNDKGVILPAKYIASIQPLISQPKAPLWKIKSALIQAFGERGKWIFSLAKIEEPAAIDILELSKSERKEHFEKRLKVGNSEETILFLEEVFEGESTANKKGYLKKMTSYLSEKDKPILDWMVALISSDASTNKAQGSLKAYAELLQITLPNTEKYNSFFTKVYSQIWKKKGILSLGGLSLKTKSNLTNIFQPLEAYPISDYLKTIFGETMQTGVLSLYVSQSVENGSVDQYLFFTLATVPVDAWCQELGLSKKQFVKAVHKIKKMDKAEITTYSFAEALIPNAFRHQDAELALVIFEVLGLTGIDPKFLSLMPSDEAIAFVEKHTVKFKKLELNLINLAVEEIGSTQKWSEAFSKIALKNSLDIYLNSRHSLRKSIWKGGPFYHKAVINHVPGLIAKSQHNENLQDDFNELFNIKLAFDRIKN